jgi:hypothetical protein
MGAGVRRVIRLIAEVHEELLEVFRSGLLFCIITHQKFFYLRVAI